ncbi:CIA30 family protein [Aeoliella sp. ICT_H6.2]|uniref:CIA30 family protein n=1 Tax=Aeoliella straminimaris TaxID=2954799 RepID=A0A9X2FET1_9BACT|nr:CIA30 family protein [Aeoliella straminimaris]MCO6042751.1 CIA30 family protein [Aeoliella straminimaris]
MIFRTMLLLSLVGGTAVAADEDAARTVLNFENDEASKQWGTVNDGVMGGRSDGRYEITDDNMLRFFGTLSLANNGGFASVRSQQTEFGLVAGDNLVMRVRGDGRTYSMNLYTSARRMAFSYRASFETVKDEWVEVSIPVEDFVAMSFGRVVRNSPLDPTQVNRVGVVLGDKKAGPFELKIEWIKVSPASTATEASHSKEQELAEKWKAFLEKE